ncbi:MAG TPA: nucleotidyl transferase AbiEii/AbiGii toxin family protein [Bacteroidales bacterium]|nr:nucleotidyl transferase AbiEii/AbiGii toxin family protein [Bacteroidales bacterium]
MIDINRHKLLMVSLLKDIYDDIELATVLGFKGGTAHMLFYGLPRFSVDLDFNLLSQEKSKRAFQKIREILLQYGRIRDEAEKHFGLICVLDYGAGNRNLKIEISNRLFPDSYEIKNYLSIPMVVMTKKDMFAHKLCALLDRKVLTSRDVFDVYFYMKDQTPVNREIVELRMQMGFEEYMDACIERIEQQNPKKLLDGVGELIDEKLKSFVRTKLKQECLQLLRMYKTFPFS